ncbi:hypothetical protein KSD_23670 [Ktedonobacter sp. SOSP1-85]|nr:hypothetical protein KSD_23670 [Ktedonobacter sp. SOSP1-85]
MGLMETVVCLEEANAVDGIPVNNNSEIAKHVPMRITLFFWQEEIITPVSLSGARRKSFLFVFNKHLCTG